MIKGTVKVDLRALKRFQAALRSDLRGSTNGPVRAAIHQWAMRYRSFAQERFDTFSKGGGNWQKLSAATIRGRRGKQQRVSILRDTGTLFNALAPTFDGKPGQLQQDIPFGVRVGFGGAAKHPTANATVADIARFHDQGLGRNPQRQIIVKPPSSVTRLMATDMERGLKRLKDATND